MVVDMNVVDTAVAIYMTAVDTVVVESSTLSYIYVTNYRRQLSMILMMMINYRPGPDNHLALNPKKAYIALTGMLVYASFETIWCNFSK